MKKLKIYDVNDLLMRSHNLEAFYFKKVAIFQGAEGVVIAEHEAVHKCEIAITDSIKIEANTPTPKNHIAIMPDKMVIVTIKEILEGAKFEEMTVDEFFKKRDYNSRCKQNWSLLMESLHDIGFDISEYL